MIEFEPVYDSFFVLKPEDTLKQVHLCMQSVYPDFPTKEMSLIENDILDLFNGAYPGYRASTAHYHDLPHTMSVYLAVTRLICGMNFSGHTLSMKHALNSLCGALFHDVGLIQTDDDTTGTGAKYTAGHEQRSMEFVQAYFSSESRNFSFIDLRLINKTIACTILSVDPSSLKFSDSQERMASFAVGASDLYAQMADRAYLEKLLLLYDEFVEAHIPGYQSPLDLLRGTQGFWDYVVRPRIQDKMENIGDYFSSYFEKSRGVSSNLYLESILNNLAYLGEILEDHEACYREMLRRTNEFTQD
ncbi:hypothetical protein [Spirochaeta dissipatitropha]